MHTEESSQVRVVIPRTHNQFLEHRRRPATSAAEGTRANVCVCAWCACIVRARETQRLSESARTTASQACEHVRGRETGRASARRRARQSEGRARERELSCEWRERPAACRHQRGERQLHETPAAHPPSSAAPSLAPRSMCVCARVCVRACVRE